MSKRLDLKDPKVFDTWRSLYNELTDAEQHDFYNALERKYPTQTQHHRDYFVQAFEGTKPLRVLEAGGWKGELAAWALKTFPNIKKWTNIEFCKNAFFSPDQLWHDRYSVHSCKDFKWWKQPRYIDADVFVSAHMIEHISDADLLELLDWCDGIPLICLEAPIKEATSDWTGYIGTHILEMGWEKISEYLDDKGYKRQKINHECSYYRLR